MIKKLLVLATTLTFGISLAACSAAEVELVEAEEHSADEHANTEQMMETEMDHAHVDAPNDFAALENPFSGDASALEAGKVIFETNCAACHGISGQGDGPAAAGLNPAPANLSDGDMIGMLSDGYLFWRVSKGGMMEPFNSMMPAWENVLSEDQRWQAISYVRSLGGESGMDMSMGAGVVEEHNDGDDH